MARGNVCRLLLFLAIVLGAFRAKACEPEHVALRHMAVETTTIVNDLLHTPGCIGNYTLDMRFADYISFVNETHSIPARSHCVLSTDAMRVLSNTIQYVLTVLARIYTEERRVSLRITADAASRISDIFIRQLGCEAW